MLRPLRAELRHIALKGTGAFDLLSQDFKASVKATLSPELEQLDRACRGQQTPDRHRLASGIAKATPARILPNGAASILRKSSRT